MSRRRLPPLEAPAKLLSEMTPEERREYALALRRQVRAELRELERPAREKLLRQGRAKPRNRQEWEIFAANLVDKTDARTDQAATPD